MYNKTINLQRLKPSAVISHSTSFRSISFALLLLKRLPFLSCALLPLRTTSSLILPSSSSLAAVTSTFALFASSSPLQMSSSYSSNTPPPSPSPSIASSIMTISKDITNLNQLISQNTSSSIQNQILHRTIPPLTSKSHKGSSGRVSILGGSAKYTGAPYYAAMSALRTGCDLVTVHCANEATIPLKSYSPELMVEGVYSASQFDTLVDTFSNSNNNKSSSSSSTSENKEEYAMDEATQVINEMVHKVSSSFDRLHAIIIGPGLGRCPIVMEATSIIIQKAMGQNLNIVLDADGLFLLSMEGHWDIFTRGLIESESKSKVILTPNVVEYKRLVDSMGEGSEDILRSKLRGVTIIRKGHEDIIEYVPKSDDEKVQQLKMICSEQGGLKRSGGLGDILAGSVGTFVAWHQILSSSKDKENYIENLVLGCWMASCLTKRSTMKSFQKRKRSMTAPDVIEEIGDVVDEIASSTIQR